MNTTKENRNASKGMLYGIFFKPDLLPTLSLYNYRGKSLRISSRISIVKKVHLFSQSWMKYNTVGRICWPEAIEQIEEMPERTNKR